MRKSQVALLLIFIVVTGLIYLAVMGNKKGHVSEMKEEKTSVFLPVREVNNSAHTISLTSHGQVTPYSEVVISSEVQGMLEKGKIAMKPGEKFRQGDLLYTINNDEAYLTYFSRRSSYANMILNAIPDIELDFPSEKNKWLKFMDDINDAGKRLPPLPDIKSPKERMFLTSRSVISEYYNLRSLEARLDKYIIVAPFDGTVIEVFMEPGTIANPGAQIAKIARTGDYEVKVPIALTDLGFFKEKSEATFTNSSGELIGTGSIKRTSDVINRMTQSADVYYSIKPVKDAMIYNGMYLNVSIDKSVTKETMTLPRAALKDNKVALLNKGAIRFSDVRVVGSKPDSVHVIGLNNGDTTILEYPEKIEPKITYKGVIR